MQEAAKNTERRGEKELGRQLVRGRRCSFVAEGFYWLDLGGGAGGEEARG